MLEKKNLHSPGTLKKFVHLGENKKIGNKYFD